MSDPKAEAAVKKLARLLSNTICPNCGTRNKYGFSTVCIKFHTFVCNQCKSSHQAVSHRCKSLTMSSWTMEEVEELKRKGNDYARKTWMGRAPTEGQGGRPKEGDSLAVFKQFVVNAYEYKKYYQEYDESQSYPQPQTQLERKEIPTKKTVSKVRTELRTERKVKEKSKVRKPPQPTPVPTVDLLSFGTQTETVSSTNDSNISSFDSFAHFDAQKPTVEKQSTAVNGDTAALDLFAISSHLDSSTDNFAPKTKQSVATSSNVSFDPFSSTSFETPNSSNNPSFSKPTKQIMKSNGMSNMNPTFNSSNSAMSRPMQTFTQQQQMMMMQQQMMNMSMNGNMNMNMNMNNAGANTNPMNMNKNIFMNNMSANTNRTNGYMNGSSGINSNNSFSQQSPPVMAMNFGSANGNGYAISGMGTQANRTKTAKDFDPFASIGI